jgi:hypothetical protein
MFRQQTLFTFGRIQQKVTAIIAIGEVILTQYSIDRLERRDKPQITLNIIPEVGNVKD